MKTEIEVIGHRERLRLRADSGNMEGIKPHEMIELLFFCIMPRVDMSETARALIERFKTFQELFEASEEQLLQVSGMTKTTAQWIVLTADMLKIYDRNRRMDQPMIWNYRDLMRFMGYMRHRIPAPRFCMMYTDMDHQLMALVPMGESTHWADPQYASDIVMDVLSLKARHAYLVLFTGIEYIEFDDYEMDYLVSFARMLNAVDVELLDCVLVGEFGIYSMNRAGKMDAVRRESACPRLHEEYLEDSEKNEGNE